MSFKPEVIADNSGKEEYLARSRGGVTIMESALVGVTSNASRKLTNPRSLQ